MDLLSSSEEEEVEELAAVENEIKKTGNFRLPESFFCQSNNKTVISACDVVYGVIKSSDSKMDCKANYTPTKQGKKPIQHKTIRDKFTNAQCNAIGEKPTQQQSIEHNQKCFTYSQHKETGQDSAQYKAIGKDSTQQQSIENKQLRTSYKCTQHKVIGKEPGQLQALGTVSVQHKDSTQFNAIGKESAQYQLIKNKQIRNSFICTQNEAIGKDSGQLEAIGKKRRPHESIDRKPRRNNFAYGQKLSVGRESAQDSVTYEQVPQGQFKQDINTQEDSSEDPWLLNSTTKESQPIVQSPALACVNSSSAVTKIKLAKVTEQEEIELYRRKRYKKSKKPELSRLTYDAPIQDLNEFDDEERWPQVPLPDNIIEGSSGEFIVDLPGQAFVVNKYINTYLFEYQREGVTWMLKAFSAKHGGVLGDEMGLGKTIQVIAFVSAILKKTGTIQDQHDWHQLRDKRRKTLKNCSNDQGCVQLDFDESNGNPGPILIVVPASLLQNWEYELKVWMCIETIILHGKPAEREIMLQRIARGDYEVVILSYDLLRNAISDLKRIDWFVVVLDEMHVLKNPDSLSTHAVQQLQCNCKIGLTGTLMQNNEEELHCLINIIQPDCLGSLAEFRSYYARDIKYARKKSADQTAIARSLKKATALNLVLNPYYLRRKKDVNPYFDTIEKVDKVVFCPLTPLQSNSYQRILNSPEYQLLRFGNDDCDCGRQKQIRKKCCYSFPKEKSCLWDRFHPDGQACKKCPDCIGLVCVAQLLKLSNHLDLLKVDAKDPLVVRQATEQFAKVAFGEDLDDIGGFERAHRFQEMKKTDTCGKMKVLSKLLEVWKSKREKVLIFSRSTRMLDILQMFLIGEGYLFVRLDGGTKVKERLQLVRTFNKDKTILIFLISTKAGGLGLNITSASNVVLFDPSWNPAHDLQAQDRAYRIGQRKNVQVFRLVTLGTIEEMIYVRQIYKQQLTDTTLKTGEQHPRYFEAIQGDPTQQGELFGIRNLLQFKENGVLRDIQQSYYAKERQLSNNSEDNNLKVGQDFLIEDNVFQYSKCVTTAKVKSNKNLDADVDATEFAAEVLQLVEQPHKQPTDCSRAPSRAKSQHKASKTKLKVTSKPISCPKPNGVCNNATQRKKNIYIPSYLK